MKMQRLRFKLRRYPRAPVSDAISGGEFIGFVRALTKGKTCKVINTIETESTAEFFVVDAYLPAKVSEFAKAQAESYGVIVEVRS